MTTTRHLLQRKDHAIHCVGPEDPVLEAIRLMAEHHVGALLVMRGDELVGIVSERDYARKVILQGRSSRDTTVREIMTPSPVTVTSAQTVDDCLRIVTEKRIRHLPVVDAGELKGLVSIGDLVKTIISSQAYTIDQLHTYIEAGYPS